MSILPRFPRFALVPLVPLMVTGFGVGWGLAAPAGAEPTGDPVTDQCPSAFGSHTTSAISFTTDPPARSDARPGQAVKLDVAWAPEVWQSLSSVLVCVRVAGAVDHDLSAAESPAVDDGAFHHGFTVPDSHLHSGRRQRGSGRGRDRGVLREPAGLLRGPPRGHHAPGSTEHKPDDGAGPGLDDGEPPFRSGAAAGGVRLRRHPAPPAGGAGGQCHRGAGAVDGGQR